jgi:hypothetical protein
MAVIKGGILGGGSGKVGNVTMTSWKGRSIIKGRPESVANPQTAGQVTNRSAFKSASQFASSINSSMIIPLMNRFAGNITGNNAFMSRNKANFDVDGLAIPGDLNFGTGRLGATTVNGANATSGSPQIDISWSATLDNQFKLSTDKLYVMVVSSLTGEVLYQGLTAYTRVSATGNVQCERSLTSGEDVYLYGVFLRADGTQVGDTSYQLVEED